METKIKDETKDQSLCFESSGEDVASLTLVEKYDRYCQSDNLDVDSDEDFFPDELELQEEYARLRTDTANLTDPKRRLTTGLSRKKIISDPELSTDNEDVEQPHEGKSNITCFDSVRKCGPEGNSIFCTQIELEEIKEFYRKIIDFIKNTKFEKDLTEQQSEEENKLSELLSEKMERVRQARDKFYEVEQIVKEQLIQLEVVERYKLGSVG